MFVGREVLDRQNGGDKMFAYYDDIPPASDNGAHCDDHDEYVGTCAACHDADNVAFLAGE